MIAAVWAEDEEQRLHSLAVVPAGCRRHEEAAADDLVSVAVVG
jgi:hypothetical protein